MLGLGRFVLGLLFQAQRHCRLFQAAVVEDHSPSFEAANSMEAGCRSIEGFSMLRLRGFAWVYVLGVHHMSLSFAHLHTAFLRNHGTKYSEVQA